jgi:hypothetical protein
MAWSRSFASSILKVAAPLLVLLLALSPTASATSPTEVPEEPVFEEAPHARLDFRFKAPRVSLGLRGGWKFNRAEGEIYDFLVDQLTLEKSDFSAPSIIFDVSWHLTSWLDVMFGTGYSGREVESEDRFFEDSLGNPVVQYTRLGQVPLLFSAKLYPLGRGKQIGKYAWIRKAVVPYIGGGIGATWYQLKQEGEFVDTGDPNVEADEIIFKDVFVSSDWAFAQHVFVGLDFKLTRSFGLILEGRYDWAEAEVKGSFVGFDPIDLDGAQILIGVSWKL